VFYGDKCLYVFQSNYPARVKQLHMYNIGALMDLMMTIIKFCTPEKIQQRVETLIFINPKFHGSSFLVAFS